MNKKHKLILFLFTFSTLLVTTYQRGKTYEDLADIIKNSNSHHFIDAEEESTRTVTTPSTKPIQ